MTNHTTSLDHPEETLHRAHEPTPGLPKAFHGRLSRPEDTLGVADERAFGKQLAALQPRLRGYARSLTRDPDSADDLVQDTMLRAWSARERFEQGTNLRAWTYTILRNLFKSGLRRARFVGEYDEIVSERRLAGNGNQVATVELAEVTQAIGQLSRDQQEALTLVAVQGLSYEEAAERTGAPLGTLKSRVARARAAIEVMLDCKLPLGSPKPAKTLKSVPELQLQPARRNAWAAAKASNKALWIG